MIPVCAFPEAINSTITGNGDWLIYTVAGSGTSLSEKWVVISVEHDPADFDLNAFFFVWNGNWNRAVFLDPTLVKGSPYIIFLGQLNMRLPIDTEFWMNVTNWSAASDIIFRRVVEPPMMEEEKVVMTQPRLFEPPVLGRDERW